MAKSDRKTIDKIFILLGAAVTAVLLVAGGLAWYGYKFATNSVRTELSAQKVYFPAKGSPAKGHSLRQWLYRQTPRKSSKWQNLLRS